MKWTNKEKVQLRKQVKAGVSLENIRVGDRTTFAIKYQLYNLDLSYNSKKWKKSELRDLKAAVKTGVPLQSIKIPGRTKQAIRNKLLRLKLLKTRKRRVRLWNTHEIALLKRLVTECGYTSNTLFTNNWFPGRSKDSIAQQMRRLRIKKSW